MSNPSALPVLAPHKETIANLLDVLEQAHQETITELQPRASRSPKFSQILSHIVRGSNATLAKLPIVPKVWFGVCALMFGVDVLRYFKNPGTGIFGDLILPLITVYLIYRLAPCVLFGWFHIGPALKARAVAQSKEGQWLLRAIPEVFVAQEYDKPTGNLQGIYISRQGEVPGILGPADNTTDAIVPSGYVRYQVPGGVVVHVLNARSRRSYVWFHGAKVLEGDGSLKYIALMHEKLESQGAMEAVCELAELAGSYQRERVKSEALSFKAPPAPVATSVPSTWDSLILNAGFKEELQEVVEMLKNAAELRKMGFEPPSTLLLYGPPGTGKTQVARTLASMSGLSFLAKSANDLKGEYIGQSAPRVRQIFEEARAKSPAILFIDEIESVASKRDGGSQEKDRLSDEIVAELLVQMDGVLKRDGDVFVVAATNFPDKVDSAILSRFTSKKEIPLPDLDARRRMLSVFLEGKPLAPDLGATLDAIALGTNGSSGRDLRALADTAARRAVARALKEGDIKRALVTPADFV